MSLESLIKVERCQTIDYPGFVLVDDLLPLVQVDARWRSIEKFMVDSFVSYFNFEWAHLDDKDHAMAVFHLHYYRQALQHSMFIQL